MKARIYLTNGEMKVYDIAHFEIKVECNLVYFTNNEYYNNVVAIFNLDKIIGFDFISK